MEANENENKTVQNLWNSAKAVIRGKYISVQSTLEARKISNIQPNLAFKELKRNSK